MCEVRDQTCLVCPASHGDGGFYGLEADIIWFSLMHGRSDVVHEKGLTAAAVPNDAIQDSDKVGDHMVHMVETSKNSNDI